MMTRYGAWIDGVALHEIDNSIYIMDIEESTPSINVMTGKKGAGEGMFVTVPRLQHLSVTIRVMVHEYDTVKRKEIFGRIAALVSQGKYLAISDRPGQRLRVKCYTPLVVPSALKWTNVSSIVFDAYEKPYWEESMAHTVTIPAGGEKTLSLGGNSESAKVSVRIQNTGALVLNDARITVDKTFLNLQGLNLPPGATLDIYYDDDGILRIPDGCRTPESSDDLLAMSGSVVAVAYNADVPSSAKISARGRYY